MADAENNRLRRIDRERLVACLAGCGVAGRSGHVRSGEPGRC